jgi:hypothetical protein
MKGLETTALTLPGTVACLHWVLERSAWTTKISDKTTRSPKHHPIPHGFHKFELDLERTWPSRKCLSSEDDLSYLLAGGTKVLAHSSSVNSCSCFTLLNASEKTSPGTVREYSKTRSGEEFGGMIRCERFSIGNTAIPQPRYHVISRQMAGTVTRERSFLASKLEGQGGNGLRLYDNEMSRDEEFTLVPSIRDRTNLHRHCVMQADASQDRKAIADKAG